LGRGRDVRPAVIIHNGTTLDAGSPALLQSNPNRNVSPSSDQSATEGDAFLTGKSHKDKRRRKAEKVTASVEVMLSAFKDKWEEDKERYEVARQEDLDITHRILQSMEEQQKTMASIAVAVTEALKTVAHRP